MVPLTIVPNRMFVAPVIWIAHNIVHTQQEPYLLGVTLQEGQPQDLDARAAWSWWKAKKWVLHITYRLFNRYGDPKATRSGADGQFVKLFSQQCSLKFLEAHMKLMAAYSQVITA